MLSWASLDNYHESLISSCTLIPQGNRTNGIKQTQIHAKRGIYIYIYINEGRYLIEKRVLYLSQSN